MEEPRKERNRILLLRAEQLASRLQKLKADPRLVSLARTKVRHEAFRSSLLANRLFRVVPVLVRAGGGWYRHFGMGAQDVLRDLIQPGR